MIHLDNYQYLRIGLASPEQIRGWAERILPNGEVVGRVTNPDTIDYKTHKPQRDGLFCERIFGPTKSGVCACGKYQSIPNEPDHPGFCERCGVELTQSQVRRHRMGYIQLESPVAHIWYVKNRPSYIPHLLEIPLKDIVSLVYCDSFIIGPGISSSFRLLGSLTKGAYEIAYKRASESISQSSYQPVIEAKLICSWLDIFWLTALWLFLSRWYIVCEKREMATGGYAIQKMLMNLRLETELCSFSKRWQKLVLKLAVKTMMLSQLVYEKKKKTRSIEEIQSDIEEIQKNIEEIQREKLLLVRSTKIRRYLVKSKMQPEWMVLSVLPVLPPDLRPIVELREGLLITSDLNELYRRVLFRNKDIKDFLTLFSTEEVVFPGGLVARLQRKYLQYAVDALLANGMGGTYAFRDQNNRVYKSFSDCIKGKKGRFRENLLGKRVDYSGRSVIVVGPWLALHQCGLPREMAIELFQPFVIRELITSQIVPNLRAAKNLIQRQQPIVWKVLKKILQDDIVVLNRAPTLHRLGVLAFQPILVKDRAIHLHPLVCTGFNADFDGDQMAVHVPLSPEAKLEARILMYSKKNILSPATGRAVAVPSQDMLLGLYVLTLEGSVGIYKTRQLSLGSPMDLNVSKFSVFCSFNDVLMLLHKSQISFSSFLWFLLEPEYIHFLSSREVPIEAQYDSIGTGLYIYEHSQNLINRKGQKLLRYILTTAGRVVMNQQIKQAIDYSEIFKNRAAY
jgi:DNA-directed RNA polymerase beta' subunit